MEGACCGTTLGGLGRLPFVIGDFDLYAEFIKPSHVARDAPWSSGTFARANSK
jgi:hypothetical protein